MAFRKWVRVKSRRENVARVAARMLRARLAAVAHFLPLAAKKADENVEYVHQLRVWSRRSVAAVELCDRLLPKRDRRKLEKQLKLVRKAAGTARDADVLRQKVSQLKAGAAREHLLAEAERQRAEAQPPILEASRELRGGKDLLVQLEKVAKRLRRKEDTRPYDQPLARWAGKRLRPLVKEFYRRGKEDHSDLAALHRFRIVGKRLRYAMELVAGAFDASFRKQLYAKLDAIQTQLGAINDAGNFVTQIEAELGTAKKRPLQTQLRRTLTAQRKRLAAARGAWTDFWTSKRARGLKKRFEEYL